MEDILSSDIQHQWMSNKYLCWGLGPITVANIAFFSSTAFLELCLASGYLDDCMISYGQKKSRREAIAATRSRIGALTQLKMCLWIMSGPQAILSVVLNTFIMDFLVPINESNEEPPALTRAALQIIALLIIGDFCLYWGHRIQHMNNILWNNCHWFHHQIDSPTPVSTVYIEKTDASLQGGFPIIVAAAVVQPHPFVMYAYIMLRVADNAINHSGVESTVLNILFLKCLPLRGSVSHHDSHHRFSNYTTNAKNFGEYFYIWDVIFGTYADMSAIMANAKKGC